MVHPIMLQWRKTVPMLWSGTIPNQAVIPWSRLASVDKLRNQLDGCAINEMKERLRVNPEDEHQANHRCDGEEFAPVQVRKAIPLCGQWSVKDALDYRH